MEEKIVLVTGTGGGIGAACARGLLEDGNKVTALDVKPVHETVLKASHEDNYIALEVDVSSLEACRNAVKQTIDKFGRLDAVCHFAAIHSTLNWEDVSNKEFNRVLEVNVVGSFNVAKAAGEWMKENGGGAIVLTSSGSPIRSSIDLFAAFSLAALVYSAIIGVSVAPGATVFTRILYGPSERARERLRP